MCLLTKKNRQGKSNGWVIYPTYTLAEELFVGPFADLLDEVGIKHDYNISKHLFTTPYGQVRIFQLQKPARIVGTELTWVGFDEFDVESYKNCDMAFKKAIARMRGCSDPQMFFVSTPEGNHYLYKIFVSDNEKGDRKYFKGRSVDNAHLPKGYIDFLEENYDERLLKAYRDGEFVNLTQGQVYYNYSAENDREFPLDPNLPLILMADFNASSKPMSWNIGQQVGDETRIRWALWKIHANTFQMCEHVESVLSEAGQIRSGRMLYLYGDYSGVKETSNSSMSDWEIIERHFSGLGMKVEKRIKPCKSVRNGVNAVNARLKNAKGERHIVLFPGKDTDHLRQDLNLTVWDASGMREDQSNDMRSHASSALRYYCDREFAIRPRTKGTIT